MKLYLISQPECLKRLEMAGINGIKRTLISYLDLDKSYPLLRDSEIVVDCAMFRRRKKPLTRQNLYQYLDEYVAVINRHRDKENIKWYAEMDYYGYFPERVIDDIRKELETQTGAYILPVYHRFQPIEKCYKLADKYPYIGIAGLVEEKTFLNLARNKIKTHLFGITASDLLLQYPVYSADSSSWWRYLIFRSGIVGNITARVPRQVDCLSYCTDTLTYYNLVEEYITRYWKERGIDYGD